MPLPAVSPKQWVTAREHMGANQQPRGHLLHFPTDASRFPQGFHRSFLLVLLSLNSILIPRFPARASAESGASASGAGTVLLMKQHGDSGEGSFCWEETDSCAVRCHINQCSLGLGKLLWESTGFYNSFSLASGAILKLLKCLKDRNIIVYVLNHLITEMLICCLYTVAFFWASSPVNNVHRSVKAQRFGKPKYSK